MKSGVENASNAYVNLQQTLLSAVHHIHNANALQEKVATLQEIWLSLGEIALAAILALQRCSPSEKVTPCCDNLVLTYRKRGHFLCPCCVEYTTTQDHTTMPCVTHTPKLSV
jgi:Zn finger protein HypA/HybF involved in hydrogenase expression